MKVEIMRIWVKALRSRRYRQGRSVLHKTQDHGQTFCCLGVLCDLAHRMGAVRRSPLRMAFGWDKVAYGKNGDTTELPLEVKEWAGMKSTIGKFHFPSKPGVPKNLMSQNDDGRTFTQIADSIEEHYTAL